MEFCRCFLCEPEHSRLVLLNQIAISIKCYNEKRKKLIDDDRIKQEQLTVNTPAYSVLRAQGQ